MNEKASARRTHVRGQSSVYTLDNLWKVARLLWQEKFDAQLPEILCSVERCKGIGNLYAHYIESENNDFVACTREYFPSIYDDKMKKLPEKEGYAFTKLNTSRSAFLWWLICTQQSETSRSRWADDILKGQSTREMHTQGRLFCTMSKDSEGVIWIHYKERRMRLL
jgi:hypothetical protein